ncbi:uncharacterized protein CIMG_12711 [Coccidioides immitis RS]|uniref:Uncharacterized protein n=1 Tax=Coccidioides immitis (strain RS) TaxID=246410 RepID=J3KKY0_COCIM|nr:uncharacterized protein CIMG_12711 [Coccidioides immitis RS]EAS36876.3 hypothetical protein CIMG_12711 [Coccidioides immitis RS]TPX25064.1 hypothetical protein DIZ76_010513 [Coccidioides immitis]
MRGKQGAADFRRGRAESFDGFGVSASSDSTDGNQLETALCVPYRTVDNPGLVDLVGNQRGNPECLNGESATISQRPNRTMLTAFTLYELPQRPIPDGRIGRLEEFKFERPFHSDSVIIVSCFITTR